MITNIFTPLLRGEVSISRQKKQEIRIVFCAYEKSKTGAVHKECFVQIQDLS
jgi:hypothetical protein